MRLVVQQALELCEELNGSFQANRTRLFLTMSNTHNDLHRFYVPFEGHPLRSYDILEICLGR